MPLVLEEIQCSLQKIFSIRFLPQDKEMVFRESKWKLTVEANLVGIAEAVREETSWKKKDKNI